MQLYIYYCNIFWLHANPNYEHGKKTQAVTGTGIHNAVILFSQISSTLTQVITLHTVQKHTLTAKQIQQNLGNSRTVYIPIEKRKL